MSIPLIFLSLFPDIRGEPYTSVFYATKNDEIEYFCFSFFTYLNVASYVMVTGVGFMNTPARFTFYICSTCY